jgi:hypothetical protein
MRQGAGTYATAEGRWAGMGPYYAMFPVDFADRVVRTYTTEGDCVLDPFSGRGTALFSAASQSRSALGIEINPVGWVFGQTKLDPADESVVAMRLTEVGLQADRYKREAAVLPKFFRHCFAEDVLRFLVGARAELNWRRSRVDRTVMAFILVYLHGKRGWSLSNQMRQTKSMAPDYAVRWWTERNLVPPELDPVAFLLRRARWRYAKGRPNGGGGQVLLGDATTVLARLGRKSDSRRRIRLLFTSPPYLGVTNYHYDQWLRLWVLGGRPDARRSGELHRGKFEDRSGYRDLLRKVFEGSKPLLDPDAVVYVRTDRRRDTYAVTREVLTEVFPEKRLSRRVRPLKGPSQTRLFGKAGSPVGEVDLVLLPN